MSENHFMVIIEDHVNDTIKLPYRFTMKHGRQLTNTVSLRTRDKIKWTVQTKKTNGDIWLDVGWAEFARVNNIKSKFAVFFEYGGYSNFAVTIYHFAAVENPHPNYPLGTTPAEFFKCISTNECLQKLKLPQQFSILFAKKLGNPLSVFPGDQTIWKLYWRMEDGEIVIYRGWKDAVAHMSLSVGDFSFFTYHENSIITVRTCKASNGQITFSSRRMAEIQMMQQTLWTTVVNEYILSKSKPLYIPAAVVKNQLRNKPAELEIKTPLGAVQKWSLIWNTTRSGNEAYLGRGWYEFVVDYPLAMEQTVRFFTQGNGAIIHVEVA